MPRRVQFDADPDRILANREMGRAYRAIGAARVFFITLAVGSGLVFAVILLMFLSMRGRGRPAVLALVFQGAVFAIFLAGSLRIRKEPLLWALVGALIETVSAVLTLGLIPIFLAACCWAVVIVVAPLPRLLRQYPELGIAAKLRGERRPREARSGRRRRR